MRTLFTCIGSSHPQYFNDCQPRATFELDSVTSIIAVIARLEDVMVFFLGVQLNIAAVIGHPELTPVALGFWQCVAKPRC